MLDPLRFAYPYYSRRAGRLAFSTVATALQSLLFIPALLLVRRAFDTAIPSGDVAGLIWIGAPDTVYYLADGKLIRQPSPEPVAIEFAARPEATVGG
jgi:hypothetical protein